MHQTLPVQFQGLDRIRPADQDAVMTTLTRLFAGFQNRNASALERVYTDDADWVNAFGSVKRGSAEILSYLAGLFSDANFAAGQIVAPPQSTIRCLTGDIVVVSTHLQVRGQGLVGGGDIALRDNHSLRVLQRQPDDTWRVVSDIYMDAREDRSYVGHS